MPRYFAFLRAINVGGHHTVTMEKLRALFEAMGFADVETFIASGNVIFTSNSEQIPALQQKIEKHLHKSLGYEVTTFLRTEPEVAAIARYKPFEESRVQSAGAFYVAFLDAPLTAAQKHSLTALRGKIDDFHIHGREVYWHYKKNQSASDFSNADFEKALKVRSTFRGVNTIVKLAAKHIHSGVRA